MKKRFFVMFLAVVLVLAQGTTALACNPSDSSAYGYAREVDDYVAKHGYCRHSAEGIDICYKCYIALEDYKAVKAYETGETYEGIGSYPRPLIANNPVKKYHTLTQTIAEQTDRVKWSEHNLDTVETLSTNHLSIIDIDNNWKNAPMDDYGITNLTIGHSYCVGLVIPESQRSESEYRYLSIQIMTPRCNIKSNEPYRLRVRILDTWTGEFFEYDTELQIAEGGVLDFNKRCYDIKEIDNSKYLTLNFVVRNTGEEFKSVSEITSTSRPYLIVDWYINRLDRRFIDAVVAQQ